ncbi:MAG: hypothetical protein HUU57_10995 [Bdellovibrio sp.]|nr:hypothetical protein [Bdellovibrio sp.]
MKTKLLITVLVSLISASSAFADVKVVKSKLYGTGHEVNGIVNFIEPLLPIGDSYYLLYGNDSSAKEACKMVGMQYHSFQGETTNTRDFATLSDGALRFVRGTIYLKVLSCKAR